MICAKRYYFTAFSLAIVLHLIIFGLLFLSLRQPHLYLPATSQPEKIVQAVSVNQDKVQSEIRRLKAQAKAKREAEQAHQRQLAKAAAAAREARQKEEKQLAQLKVQQQQLAMKRQAQALAAEKQLGKMKEEQALAAKNLANLKQKQTMLQKQQQVKEKLQKQKQQQLQAEKMLQQQIQQEQHQMSAAKEKQIKTEVDKYKALILNAIGQQWIMPPDVNKNLSAELHIHLAPDGDVLLVTLLKGSGNAVLDRSIITAVWKASPLPVPSDSDTFGKFRELHLMVRPEGLLNA